MMLLLLALTAARLLIHGRGKGGDERHGVMKRFVSLPPGSARLIEG